MKHFKTAIVSLILFNSVYGNGKDSVINYNLPDSAKAIAFLAEININPFNTKKEVDAGIKTNMVSLSFSSERNKKEIVFEFPDNALVVAKGSGVKTDGKGELSWSYNWDANESYRLLISTASDSAANFSLYSGYIWLAKEKKWKLIGTCNISGQWTTLKQPTAFYSVIKKAPLQVTVNEAWCQRNNGSWKNLSGKNISSPVINLLSHVDSLEQLAADKQIISNAIAENKTDAKEHHEGVYYKMIKEGNGRQVSVNDTVVAHYKGYLFSDGSVFDETKERPATFPLKRLIAGWQIGVPLCKVGGKIKIVIPSAMAYSIRTRAAKIPPNSILVFEVEVLDARAPL